MTLLSKEVSLIPVIKSHLILRYRLDELGFKPISISSITQTLSLNSQHSSTSQQEYFLRGILEIREVPHSGSDQKAASVKEETGPEPNHFERVQNIVQDRDWNERFIFIIDKRYIKRKGISSR